MNNGNKNGGLLTMAIARPPFTQLSESPAPVCFVDFRWARLLGIEPRIICFPLRRSTAELERVIAYSLGHDYFFNGQELKILRPKGHFRNEKLLERSGVL